MLVLPSTYLREKPDDGPRKEVYRYIDMECNTQSRAACPGARRTWKEICVGKMGEYGVRRLTLVANQLNVQPTIGCHQVVEVEKPAARYCL